MCSDAVDVRCLAAGRVNVWAKRLEGTLHTYSWQHRVSACIGVLMADRQRIPLTQTFMLVRGSIFDISDDCDFLEHNILSHTRQIGHCDDTIL